MAAKKQAPSEHETWHPAVIHGGSGVDGGFVAVCSCGEQSKTMPSTVAAADWWKQHSSTGSVPAPAAEEKD